MIISVHNPKIKLVRALMKDAKERRASGSFVVEGVRLVEEASWAGFPLQFVLVCENLGERGGKLVSALKQRAIPVEVIPDGLMKSLSGTETPQGILAVVQQQSPSPPDQLDFVLILDAIHDPGNLGTLLRSAVAAGVQAVFLAPDCADAFSPKVLRAGMGAHFRSAILSLSWGEIKKHLGGMSVFVAEMEAELSCWDADLTQPLALLIGGEAEGASRQARNLATRQVSIPMPGGFESLNAATAGSILLFEVVRQRKAQKG